MVDHINKGEKLTERPVNSKDIRDKFIIYNLPLLIIYPLEYYQIQAT